VPSTERLVGVVLAGHGAFGPGLASAVDVILGPQPGFGVLELAEDDSPERFQQRLEEAVEAVDGGAGVLVLADLPGATPFSAAARLSRSRPGVEVVGGANVPMLLDVLTQRAGDVSEVAAVAAAAGPAGIARWAEGAGAD
jgi:mannose/fructose-specific phosphotransferase system component IIA